MKNYILLILLAVTAITLVTDYAYAIPTVILDGETYQVNGTEVSALAVTINSGGTLIVNQTGNLTMTGGVSITIDDGGTFIMNGFVTGDGAFFNNNNGVGIGNYTVDGYHAWRNISINNGDIYVDCGIYDNSINTIIGNNPIISSTGECGIQRTLTNFDGFEITIDENDWIVQSSNHTFVGPSEKYFLQENHNLNVTENVDLIFDDADSDIYGYLRNFGYIELQNAAKVKNFGVITSFCENLDGRGFNITDGSVVGPGIVNGTNCGPSNLVTTTASTTQLDLDWDLDTPDTPLGPIVSFKIERESPIGGGFSTLVADTGNSNTFYNDTSLSSGTQYNYRVTGLISNGTSIGPTEDYAWTKPEAPTSPSSEIIDAVGVNLQWNAPSGTVTGYLIERENPIGTGFVVREANYTGGNSYSETGLAPNTIYNYRVAAITNPTGPYSSEFNITTGDAPLVELEYLLVAGGGGGGEDSGSGAGGGGGAGGYITGNHNVTITTYNIVVGQGGVQGAGTCQNIGTQEENEAFNIHTHGQNGTDSTLAFDGLVAIGGGGGAAGQGWCTTYGWDGGSGGGALGGAVAGIGSQGNDGGSGGAGGRGGGGAGTAGANVGYTTDSHGSVGGDGLQNDINGTNIYYAGGGSGGGYFEFSNVAPGGLGGGGDGGRGGCTVCAGPYLPSPWASPFGDSGTAGTDGLGGGGGGGGRNSGGGSPGGDGVVIFRYASDSSGLTATGGDITVDGNYTVHTFTSDGIFNVTDIFVPTSVSVLPVSSSQLNLSWVNPNATLNNQIFRSPDGATNWTSIYDSTSITSYNDTSLLSDQDYYYKIHAESGSLGINSTVSSNYTLLTSPTSLLTTTASTTQINLSWVSPVASIGDPEVEYLIVGGGGGGGGEADAGGSNNGYGGGGHGGFQNGTGHMVSVQNYPIVVGAGGLGGYPNYATDGTDSSFDGLISYGGQAGGSDYDEIGCGVVGISGGIDGTAGTKGGSPGSDGVIGPCTYGKGGGGAGGNGQDHDIGAQEGGDGGLGVTSTISGTLKWYAGGGAGGNGGLADNNSGTILGGGGDGAPRTAVDTSMPGLPNTGGGGGGSKDSTTAASGGTGIVIIRYLTGSMIATGGVETTDGDYTINTFTSSGNFNVTNVSIDSVDGYKLERESPIGGGFTTLVAFISSPDVSYNNTILASATQYNYRVSAISINSGLVGETSNEAYNWTQPDAPISPSAAPSGSDPLQLDLQWTPPSGTVTGYLIERETPIGNGFIVIEANYTGGNTYADTGLLASTTYNYRVAAITNPIGPYSPPFNATTGDAPDPPTNVTASIPGAPLDILVSWVAPLDIGENTIITGYDIIRSTDLGPYVSLVNDTAGLTYNDLAVVPSTNYTYAISTKGDVINGNFSAPSNTVTTASVSTVPFGLSALPKVHGDSVQLDWLAPTDDGGSAINGYKIERQDDGGGWGTVVANTTNTDLTYDDSGLALNILYEYRISAINGIGVGSPSATNSTEFLVGDLSISAQVFGGQLHVSSSLTNMARGIPDGTTSLLTLYIDDVGEATFFPVVEIPKGTGFNFTDLIGYPDPGNYNVHVNLTIANGVPGITQIKSNTLFIAIGGDNFDGFSFYENRLSEYTISNMTFIGDTSGYSLVVEYQEQNGDSIYYSWQNVVANATKQIPVAASSTYYITTYANPTFNFTGDNGNEGTAVIPTGYPGTHTGVSLGDPAIFNLGIDALAGESGIFGLPLVFIFIIALASIFTGRSAPMGIIFIAVALGIMVYMGMISFEFDPANQSNIATWAIIIVAVIIGVMVGKRWD